MFLDYKFSQSYPLSSLLSNMRHCTNRVALCFLCIFYYFSTCTFAQVGPEGKYFLVKELSKEWMVYDNYRKNYVPFVFSEHFNQRSIHTLVNIAENKPYKLLLYAEEDMYLFVNGALKQKIQKSKWQTFDIASLYKTYQKHQVLLSLYGSIMQTPPELLIVYPRATIEKLIAVEEESFLQIKPRQKSYLENFFILGLIFIVAFTASIYTNYPKAFEKMYSLYDTIRIKIKDDSFLISKPLSNTTLSFVGLLSFLLAYIILFIEGKAPQILDSNALFISNPTFLNTWWSYLWVSFLLFVSLIIKYFISYGFSTLFRLEKAVNLHYFKNIQYSIIFFSFFLMYLSIGSIYIVNWYELANTLIIIPIILFYVVRLILLFLTIRSSLLIKNLYLISYLCIVELIPMIIGIRYVL